MISPWIWEINSMQNAADNEKILHDSAQKQGFEWSRANATFRRRI